MLGIDKGRPGRTGDPIIVTGSATGIGLETALHLAAHGFRVFATVRSLQSRDAVLRAAQDFEVSLEVLELDITDEDSIAAGVATVLHRAGSIFGLVNNGGIGLRGCTEDCAPDEIRALMETNVLGTIAVTRAVVGHMRAAGQGRIVTVTSVGGRVPGFGVSLYCASKFAQEGFAEGLAQELAPFGVQSVIVEPGMINTPRWHEHRGTAVAANNPASPYHELFWASEAIADKLVERSRTRATDVARTIHEAFVADSPKLRYVVGRGATVAIGLRRFMPQRGFERLYYGGHIRRVMRTGQAAATSPPAIEAKVAR